MELYFLNIDASDVAFTDDAWQRFQCGCQHDTTVPSVNAPPGPTSRQRLVGFPG